jgi:hypothetical protein
LLKVGLLQAVECGREFQMIQCEDEYGQFRAGN